MHTPRTTQDGGRGGGWQAEINFQNACDANNIMIPCLQKKGEQYKQGITQRGRTVRCVHTMQKVGCFSPPVAMGPKLLNSATYSPYWYTRVFLL